MSEEDDTKEALEINLTTLENHLEWYKTRYESLMNDWLVLSNERNMEHHKTTYLPFGFRWVRA